MTGAEIMERQALRELLHLIRDLTKEERDEHVDTDD